MAEKAKSIVQMMKERISKSGKGAKDIFFVKKDGRVRVRFLTDLEESVVVPFHTKWKEFNHPCLEMYGRSCPNCHNSDASTAENFVLTVWNYETKRRELFIYKATKCTPMPALVTMYETYGTICDRDYVIDRKGEATDTVYTVIPMEKKRFRGDEQPFSKKQVLKMILKAYPPETDDDEEDEEEQDTRRKSAKKPATKTKYNDDDFDEEDDFDEDDEDDFDDEEEDEEDKKPAKKKRRNENVIGSSRKKSSEDDFDDEDEIDYSELSNAELKRECKKRGLDYTGMNREQVIDMLEDDLPF